MYTGNRISPVDVESLKSPHIKEVRKIAASEYSQYSKEHIEIEYTNGVKVVGDVHKDYTKYIYSPYTDRIYNILSGTLVPFHYGKDSPIRFIIIKRDGRPKYENMGLDRYVADLYFGFRAFSDSIYETNRRVSVHNSKRKYPFISFKDKNLLNCRPNNISMLKVTNDEKTNYIEPWTIYTIGHNEDVMASVRADMLDVDGNILHSSITIRTFAGVLSLTPAHIWYFIENNGPFTILDVATMKIKEYRFRFSPTQDAGINPSELSTTINIGM